MCTCPNYMIWRGEFTKNDRPKFEFKGHHEYNKFIELSENMQLPFIQVPCGKCLECRIQSARTWADRCTLEAKKHKYNYFITLTYEDENLPPNGSLCPRDMTLFIKRLRKKLGKFRYLYCGEYSPSLRPHYHMIMFSDVELKDLSTDFFKLNRDKGIFERHIRPQKKDYDIYYSKTIYDTWQYKGIISVGLFNYDTAAYVSQYCTKKIDKKMDDLYKKNGLVPEFLRVSTKPGIGADWFEDHDDVHFSGKLVVPSSGEAHKVSVPRYFDKLFCKKYGDDVFDLNVRIGRTMKKFNRLDTYLQGNKDFDRQCEIRAYNIKKKHHLKNGID